MKLDLTPVRQGYVAPDFGGREIEPVDPRLEQRMRRPMVIGAAIIGILVVGLGLWAAFTPLASGVAAAGEVAVETNVKTIRHKEGGTVRQILVQEGQAVKAGQPLMILDDTEAKAFVDVLQNQVDSLTAQSARAQAEATGRTTVQFPAELTSRMGDPRVAGLVRDQELLFANKYQLYQSQVQVLEQRIQQSENQILGDKAQIASTGAQAQLTDEEMSGYKELYAKGYAPKTLILRYQRSMAEFTGRRGSLQADIARLQQQMGETRMQMVSVRNQRATQAADEIHEAQSKLAEALPRLTAAKETLANTVVRAPVDGYVFNLTQYTQGGAIGSGEILTQVVPSNEPMIIDAGVKPQDIATVHEGMDAQVRIAALNPRWHGPMKAKVVMVAPDKSSPQLGASQRPAGASSVDPNAMIAFYKIRVRIDPKELTKLRPGERITPGMPASVMLISGKRTLLGFLISPITDTLEHAFHEE